MTWSRTDYLSSVQKNDLFLEIIYILRTNRWPPFQMDDLFPNIVSILRTNSILCTESLHLNGLFIPRTNGFPYDWLSVRMNPWTNDSTLRIYLWSTSVHKLMNSYQTDYLSSVRTYDLLPDKILIRSTNGWPPLRTDDFFPNRISILCTN